MREYNSGRFQKAQENAEEAICILEKLLPCDHIMLSSAKRVKALILEEIAIDNPEDSLRGSKFLMKNEIEMLKIYFLIILIFIAEQKLLQDAEELHLVALELSKKAFGEKNVQVAKHYGNLGRLYQSMERYAEAEKNHLMAIAIKEELLGLDDYEVGLSVGHLASLYNYHMFQYYKAVDLYLRSISISKFFFSIFFPVL